METNQQELEEKKKVLEKRKKGLTTNRELAGFVIILLGYYVWKSYKEGTAQWWLYLLLGLLIAGSIGVLWYDTVSIKKISEKIEALSHKDNSGSKE